MDWKKLNRVEQDWVKTEEELTKQSKTEEDQMDQVRQKIAVWTNRTE